MSTPETTQGDLLLADVELYTPAQFNEIMLGLLQPDPRRLMKMIIALSALNVAFVIAGQAGATVAVDRFLKPWIDRAVERAAESIVELAQAKATKAATAAKATPGSMQA